MKTIQSLSVNKKNIVVIFLFVVVFFQQKNIAQNLFLPFIDDFSSYVGVPNKNLWVNYGANVNRGYQFLPPTIGVVTLDVLNAKGEIYPQAGTYTFAADTLQSKPIRLDSIKQPIQKKLMPSDSLYLSFFIQPGGCYGNMWERIGSFPSNKDSIILQFYKFNQNSWQTVWSIKGTSIDSIYAKYSMYYLRVMIPIIDTAYFNEEFMFRFINYGSLDDNPAYSYISNSSQWNLDYIYLNAFRSQNDTTFRDIAFVNPAPSMLKEYSSVPAKHFSPDMLKDSLDITLINLYSSVLNSNYKYFITDTLNNELYSYNGGFENIVSYPKTRKFQTAQKHAKPESPYVFAPNDGDKFLITHIVTEGVGQDNIRYNDTMRYIQYFGNYFSYDDGTSEAGIGVEPTNSSAFALGFNLLTTDTLYSIDIYFNKAYENSNMKPFTISIYNATDDTLQQPNEEIYKTAKFSPRFDSLDKFIRYVLEEPLVLPKGNFFVAVQSISKTYLNIGFDQNSDARGHIYERKANIWSQVFLKGAPMIRPCFGYKAVGVENIAKNNDLFKIYPNPANDYITVECQDGKTIQIFDLSGRLLIEQKARMLDVSGLRCGIYIVKIDNEVKKLVVTR